VTEPLEELVRWSQRGDIEAFGRVVERFRRMACATAYAVLGDVHLAEDAAQEAFIEAFQCIGGLREPAAFPAWFRRIVLKRADRLVRGRRLETLPLHAAGDIPCAQPDPSRLAEVREVQGTIHAAVASLPEPDRVLVSLFHLGGYSQREVAAIVELPEPQVKKRLFRARLALRRHLEGMMSEEFQGQLSEGGAFARAVQFSIAVRTGDLAQVRRMLDAHPALIGERERWDEDVAQRNRFPAVGSFTALHRAAYYGDDALAALLLERGADPSAPTKIGQTPLHVAVLVDHPEIAQMLLERGANVNAATDRGMTPLHWAVIRRLSGHITRLLAAGASPDARDVEGRTPRDWAALKGIDLGAPRDAI
jgi:RNA polymerase sigma factor (sigma-70 family)